jgi:hypothetical protein
LQHPLLYFYWGDLIFLFCESIQTFKIPPEKFYGIDSSLAFCHLCRLG